MRRELILGGPGSGKTESLMGRIEKILSDGTDPSRVAFVSFTRAAVTEATDRFSQKFRFSRAKARNFRTLHSMCYAQLGLRKDQVMDQRKLRAFGASIGVKITGGAWEEAPTIEGDHMVFLIGYASAKGIPLRQAWEERGEVEWTVLKWFADSLREAKIRTGTLDFSDMLKEYLASGPPVDVDAAIVDEAQDLTAAQWRVVDRAFGSAKILIAAGDDDQALYEWAGTDMGHFRRFPADSAEVLPKSHRMPRAVFDLASEVSSRISGRYEKEWESADHDGGVHYVGGPEHLDMSSGSWLLLARNAYLLRGFEEECQSQGVPYQTKKGPSVDQDDIALIMDHEKMRRGGRLEPERERSVMAAVGAGDASKIWHESFQEMPLTKRAYYLTMLKRGENLRARPRVRIDTIHGAKGLEADSVALMTDVSPKCFAEARIRPDSENRVLYVGVSRAKRDLFLLSPQTPAYFMV
jgi:superfamily I DNA/RNA helicase